MRIIVEQQAPRWGTHRISAEGLLRGNGPGDEMWGCDAAGVPEVATAGA